MISFVIPTVNNSSSLAECINSIMQVFRNGDEIIVAHQGDKHSAFVRRMQQVQYLHVDDFGLSRARNSGAAAARNGIIAFIDDDMTVDGEFIENAESIFSSGAKVICGRIIIRGTLTPYAKSQGKSPAQISRAFYKLKKCLGGNMVFDKRYFNEIGGYDCEFGKGARFGGAEDVDIVLRALDKNKHSVVYAPSVIVYHETEKRDFSDGFMNKMYSYGTGEGAAYRKYFKRTGRPLILVNYLIELLKPAVRIIINTVKMDFSVLRMHKHILYGRISGFMGYKQ
ncbi:MAG: hypothetical protein A2293_10475 [Elusimicrobia bacterium RIFOXYB2_FULL_49_7]|nr:MAG: hypothetical protein A2293_10475 [Elusimicrobia bacterium RIFOXYB2_FULL_49_7]